MHIYAIDPKAVAVAKVAGLSRADAEYMIKEVAQRNPALLVGGYDVDAVIVAVAVTLGNEADDHALTEGDIFDRIDLILSAMYAGLL